MAYSWGAGAISWCHQLGIILGQAVFALGDRKAEEQKSIADKVKLISNITELN